MSYVSALTQVYWGFALRALVKRIWETLLSRVCGSLLVFLTDLKGVCILMTPQQVVARSRVQLLHWRNNGKHKQGRIVMQLLSCLVFLPTWQRIEHCRRPYVSAAYWVLSWGSQPPLAAVRPTGFATISSSVCSQLSPTLFVRNYLQLCLFATIYNSVC
jgi:hypothetical protein